MRAGPPADVDLGAAGVAGARHPGAVAVGRRPVERQQARAPAELEQREADVRRAGDGPGVGARQVRDRRADAAPVREDEPGPALGGEVVERTSDAGLEVRPRLAARREMVAAAEGAQLAL